MTRFLVTALLLAATAGYVFLHPPQNLAIGHGALAACPERLGAWDGTDLSFADAVVEELHADDLLIRRYQGPTDVAWLCVVVHQNRRYGAHDPRLCYESQGWEIEQPGRAVVADGTPGGLTVNRFIATRRTERRLVYYWWLTGDLATADAAAFRRAMAVSGALENRSWGAFVRVETAIRGDDRESAARAADDFATQVARTLPGVLGAIR
jgi:EpsI family protein